jgi:hypothetical protein
MQHDREIVRAADDPPVGRAVPTALAMRVLAIHLAAGQPTAVQMLIERRQRVADTSMVVVLFEA